jgi:pimeloyl-ACP methyl ester carboxylesterase
MRAVLTFGRRNPRFSITVPRMSTARSSGLGLVPLVLSVVTGCSDPVTSTPAPDALAWTPCGDGIEESKGIDETGAECATLVVPRDHADPGSPTWSIPLIRLRATGSGARLGTLVTNPGGPGISGIGYIRSEGVDTLTRLRERYDILGFDPRGAGSSEPAIECLDEPDVAAIRNQVSAPTSEAQVTLANELAGLVASRCSERFGEWLPFVGTREVARDMDRLRQALGEEKLHYLGFSYGTYLGATYADLFPQHAGRLVLDGAMNPALDYNALRRDQAVAMDAALADFVADCHKNADKTPCPLPADPKVALAALAGIVEELDVTPYQAADGRILSGSRALGLIQSATYYPPQTWTTLRDVLDTALVGDYAEMLEVAHSPALMVNPADTPYLAVMCHDLVIEQDPATVPLAAAEWAKLAPINGASRAWSTLPCRTWPARSATPSTERRAEGAGPILVVGTTRDPATPVAWARALKDALATAHYLEWNGDGHLAYGRGGACVDDAVEAFLLEGTTPAAGATCP